MFEQLQADFVEDVYFECGRDIECALESLLSVAFIQDEEEQEGQQETDRRGRQWLLLLLLRCRG